MSREHPLIREDGMYYFGMSMHSRYMFGVVALLFGCSEYEFYGDAAVVPGPTDDSGEFLSCDDFLAPSASPPTPDDTCLNEPVIGTFNPVVEWQWNSNEAWSGYAQVMMTPVVGNLTDDNGDGRVDDRDTPDIAFTSFDGSSYGSVGALNVISGDGTGTHWSTMASSEHQWLGSNGVAIGDLEGDGQPEVCVAGSTAAVICLNGQDGSLKWAAGTELGSHRAPAIADMDGDGLAEVILGRQIFSFDGQLIGLGEYGTGWSFSFAADMDGDGVLEVVAGNAVYEMDGTTVWYDGGVDGMPAVGDFNGDGGPEVVRVASGTVILSARDGTTLWQVDIPGDGNGGPPTVADFDGDGEPEVGVAALSYYTVFETDG